MNEDDDNLNVINYMIKHSIQHHLETEVIYSFCQQIENGEKDWNKAANIAMSEWDI